MRFPTCHECRVLHSRRSRDVPRRLVFTLDLKLRITSSGISSRNEVGAPGIRGRSGAMTRRWRSNGRFGVHIFLLCPCRCRALPARRSHLWDKCWRYCARYDRRRYGRRACFCVSPQSIARHARLAPGEPADQAPAAPRQPALLVSAAAALVSPRQTHAFCLVWGPRWERPHLA